jgi:hypothetical protein
MRLIMLDKMIALSRPYSRLLETLSSGCKIGAVVTARPHNAALSRKPRPKPRLRSRSGEGVTGAMFAFGNKRPRRPRKQRAGAG